MRQTGIEDAGSAEAWLHRTLDEILAGVRVLLDVTGCAFQVVDWSRGVIRPAAEWFADDETRQALEAVLTPPLRPGRGGRPRVGEGGRRAAAHRVRARLGGRRGAARPAARAARSGGGGARMGGGRGLVVHLLPR